MKGYKLVDSIADGVVKIYTNGIIASAIFNGQITVSSDQYKIGNTSYKPLGTITSVPNTSSTNNKLEFRSSGYLMYYGISGKISLETVMTYFLSNPLY